jgi:hypothetical protein
MPEVDDMREADTGEPFRSPGAPCTADFPLESLSICDNFPTSLKNFQHLPNFATSLIRWK